MKFPENIVDIGNVCIYRNKIVAKIVLKFLVERLNFLGIFCLILNLTVIHRYPKVFNPKLWFKLLQNISLA